MKFTLKEINALVHTLEMAVRSYEKQIQLKEWNFSTEPITELSNGSTGDKYIYAKWTPIVYSVTYNVNGGNLSGEPRTARTKIVYCTIAPIKK